MTEATAQDLTETAEESAELGRAYEFCRAITKEHSKSFYFSANFLNPEKRQPIYALYALCRLIDDEVDQAEVQSETEAIAAVELWKMRLDEVYAESLASRESGESRVVSQNTNGFDSRLSTLDSRLVMTAWRDMLRRYKIRQELPLELMRGVLMDTHIKRYQTWDELYVYCYRVASVVGLMSSEIFGYEEPETLTYAEALGIAMQLTNILRDVRDDAAMNRIYLPKEDLDRFGVSEDQIFRNDFDENFANLMRFEIARARDYYKQAELGIPLLNKDARFTVLLAARIYGKILNQIERQNCNVFAARAHTTKRQKIWAIPRIWLAARKM